jgi:hypothetical protein
MKRRKRNPKKTLTPGTYGKIIKAVKGMGLQLYYDYFHLESQSRQ